MQSIVLHTKIKEKLRSVHIGSLDFDFVVSINVEKKKNSK